MSGTTEKTTNKKAAEKLYIIDGHALVYRSFFAFINNPLINSKGEDTSAVYGFLSTVLRILNENTPDYMLVTFDSREATFRHEIYEEYKATREKMPQELIEQLPRITEAVETLGLASLAKPGYEADDLIGTVARKAADAGIEVFMVTGDKDLMQLVEDKVHWVNLRRQDNKTEILDRDGVKEKFGVYPEGIVEMLALMGDSSDNVPGVMGIGKVTAAKLVNEFGTVENIYENFDNIKSKKLVEKLETDRENAFMSKELVTIDRAVEFDLNLEEMRFKYPNPVSTKNFFNELEVNSLVLQIPKSKEIQKASERKMFYGTIRTKEELDGLANDLRDNPFAFDLETTSLEKISAEIVGFSFSFSENTAFYVPAVCPDFDETIMNIDEIFSVLKPILEDESIPKCAQNAKYDISVLMNYGVEVKGLAFDTLIASHLLDPDKRHNDLDYLSYEFLKITKIPTSHLIGSGKKQISMAEVPLKKIAEYACEDADCTYQLWKVLEPKIKEDEELYKLFTEVELPMIDVLRRMEHTGVKIDVDFLNKMSDDLHILLSKIEKDIFEEAGEEFNVASPKQLGDILFDKLEIHKEFNVKKVKKTKIGYSTNIAVLDQYRTHPVVDMVLDYRMIAKLLSTYVDALPRLVSGKTGRIHTSFNQFIAATGRLASTNPNLQNIPIRTETGKQIRKAFVPGKAGYKLIAADYSQIELRIMADMSSDKNMTAAFLNNEDIHSKTASSIYGIPLADVDKEMRYNAKAINFGILYGMGAFRLSRDTGITIKEAEKFIEAYFIFFPEVNTFIDSQKEYARKNGFVRTKFGRKRFITNILADNKRLVSAAENVAVNTPLQGTAAEIIKKAMIEVDKKLTEGGFETKMLIQIHDELVFEAPDAEVEAVSKMIKDTMEDTVKMSIPLTVELNSGDDWFSAH